MDSGFLRTDVLCHILGFETDTSLPVGGVENRLRTYVYRRGLINFDFSYATAVGMINSFVAMVLVVAANSVLKRIGSETTLW